MVAGRATGIGLVLAGLVGCTLASSDAGHTPPFRSGYWIVAGDFHVHGFPGDGALLPADLVREARRRRLDVIGISDHNQMLPSHIGERGSVAGGSVFAIPSEEVTTRSVHVIAVGISVPIDWRKPPERIIDAIHAQGGVAIAAHPTLAFGQAFDDDAVRRLDGLEAAHPEMYRRPAAGAEFAEFGARARMLKPAIAYMGASDFHTVQPMGIFMTYPPVHEINTAGVLEAIRAGRTSACDADGQSYGNPEYVRLTEDECRAQAAGPPHGALNRVGAASAWLGLVLLALSAPAGLSTPQRTVEASRRSGCRHFCCTALDTGGHSHA